jgi:glycogen debranching enzyme
VRYWRGPVWVLVNWMVVDGLAHAGLDGLARRLREATLALVTREGFCEYFDPRDGTGIGGQGFSWTAALTLSWLDALDEI